MAHELTIGADGVAQMFSLRETPWHGLGRILPEEIKDDKVLEMAGLDWKVDENPIFRQLGDTYEAIEGEKVLSRSDTKSVLAVVSNDYRVFQNEELVTLMRGIAQNSEVVWETAGNLRGGKVTWALGYLPKLEISVRETDKTKTFMLLTNGHGNMRSLQILPTTTRVVCNNTLSMATQGGHRIRRSNMEGKKFDKAALSKGYGIHHDGNMATSIAEVVNAYAQFTKDKDLTQAMYEQMADVTMAEADTIDYWNKVFGVQVVESLDEGVRARAMQRERDRLAALKTILASETCQTPATAGTLYGSLNAATQFADWTASRRRNSWLNVSQFGEGAKVKEKAFDLAVELLAA